MDINAPRIVYSYLKSNLLDNVSVTILENRNINILLKIKKSISLNC